MDGDLNNYINKSYTPILATQLNELRSNLEYMYENYSESEIVDKILELEEYDKEQMRMDVLAMVLEQSYSVLEMHHITLADESPVSVHLSAIATLLEISSNTGSEALLDSISDDNELSLAQLMYNVDDMEMSDSLPYIENVGNVFIETMTIYLSDGDMVEYGMRARDKVYAMLVRLNNPLIHRLEGDLPGWILLNDGDVDVGMGLPFYITMGMELIPGDAKPKGIVYSILSIMALTLDPPVTMMVNTKKYIERIWKGPEATELLFRLSEVDVSILTVEEQEVEDEQV